MIDVTSAEAISFAALARLLPRDGLGRKVAIRSLRRWATQGVGGGVILEAARVGRGWFTTRPAFAEFASARARAVRSDRARPVDVAARADAECRELEAMGI